MRWQLASCQVVGGMRPASGKAAFARGAAVLGRQDQPERLLQVHGYAGAEVEGEEIDREAWEALLGSAQAMALKEPVRATRDAALWVFRLGFADQEQAIERLAAVGALVHREVASGGSIAAVVREDLGNAVRDVLALERFDRAWCEAQAGRWPEALALADLAFVLSRGLIVERVALLALTLERVGRKTASDGVIEMAAGSRGAVFGEAVRARKAEYAAQCAAGSGERKDATAVSTREGGPTVAKAVPRRFRNDWHQENVELVRGFRLRRDGVAA